MTMETKVDLTDPDTAPNPQIKKLLVIAHEIFALQLDAQPERAILYSESLTHVNAALESLFGVKNAIARAQGED